MRPEKMLLSRLGEIVLEDGLIRVPIELFHATLCICNHFSGSVTSWYRTQRHNAVVGGCKNSGHLLGNAVDIVYDIPDERPLLTDVNVVLDELGLQLIRETTHDHLQVKRKA